MCMARDYQPDSIIFRHLQVNIRIVAQHDYHRFRIQVSYGLEGICRAFPEIVNPGHCQAVVQINALVV